MQREEGAKFWTVLFDEFIENYMFILKVIF